MSEAKFTKGPWKVCSGNKKSGGICSCFSVSSEHYPIAAIEHGEWGDSYPNVRLVNSESGIGKVAEAFMDFSGYGAIPEDESVANAKLIAVAPDMYAKLDKIATWLEGNAKLRRLHAETSGQFKSLADEYLREAKNYEATAKDVRELLAKATH